MHGQTIELLSFMYSRRRPVKCLIWASFILWMLVEVTPLSSRIDVVTVG